MKDRLKKCILGLFIIFAVTFVIPFTTNAEGKDTIILYTNDVHCAIDNYGELAAYEKQLEEAGHKVIIIDAGDHIQGEVIGSMTKGMAIVELMNTVGYDYAVPGNHEFDYKMDTFLDLALKAKYQYLSANFIDLQKGTTVFDAYEIVDHGTEQIAIIGICTPESYTKSTPAYFQDKDGKDIYGFSEKTFYETIQSAINSAIADGADRVIAVGHLGINGTTEGWKSTDVIANTTGIDVFLDAHTHEVIEMSSYKNKEGEPVILSSTGSKFAYFGKLTLSADGQSENTMLIKPDDVVVDESATQAVRDVYQAVEAKIDEYNSDVEELNKTVLGTSEVELTEYDPADGKWVQRIKETNLGDFVADAYREVSKADVALVNSGGIRASIPAGDITRVSLMNVNPWNNEMCVIEAKGQQILDALEHGTRLHPTECGGFLQVSGLTYEIHDYIESPIIVDEKNSFVGIDETKERRVRNVKIGGQAIDLDKTYTVAGSLYTLKQGGDGFTMFTDSVVIKREVLPVDSEVLIQYFTENLNGKITKEQYGNALGDGRIISYVNAQDVPEDVPSDMPEDLPSADDTPQQNEPEKPRAAKTGDEINVLMYILLMIVSVSGIRIRKRY